MIILFEIGIGAFGYANKEELNNALDKGFNKTLHNYEPNREAWDMVQSEVWNWLKPKLNQQNQIIESNSVHFFR